MTSRTLNQPARTETIPRKLASLGIVVPGLNEAAGLPQLYAELIKSLGQHEWELEILFVDDGSTDDTIAVCRELNSKDPRFQYVSLSRNFTHQHALTAGLDVVRGQAVVVMDADLQDPPHVVLEMIKVWEQGADVVHGQRKSREGETFFKRFSAKMFYRILRVISSTPLQVDTGDFRLMDRKVVDQIQNLREQGRYIRGLVCWIGFNQKSVLYAREPRYQGVTKYAFFRMIRFAWEGISSFSVVPLRLATLTGVIFSLIAFLLVFYVLVRKVFYDDLLKGWASVMVAIFAVAGAQLFFTGVIGEYLAKVFEELKERPLYIIRESSRNSS